LFLVNLVNHVDLVNLLNLVNLVTQKRLPEKTGSLQLCFAFRTDY